MNKFYYANPEERIWFDDGKKQVYVDDLEKDEIAHLVIELRKDVQNSLNMAQRLQQTHGIPVGTEDAHEFMPADDAKQFRKSIRKYDRSTKWLAIFEKECLDRNYYDILNG